MITRICGLLHGCCAISRSATRKPSCRFVNGSPRSQLASGNSFTGSSRARVENPTTKNLSRGNFVRIRWSSASATLLAAAKRPAHDIDQLMSSSSTVVVCVV